MIKKTFIIFLSIFLIPVGGCANDAQTGALIGAGVGAVGAGVATEVAIDGPSTKPSAFTMSTLPELQCGVIIIPTPF